MPARKLDTCITYFWTIFSYNLIEKSSKTTFVMAH